MQNLVFASTAPGVFPPSWGETSPRLASLNQTTLFQGGMFRPIKRGDGRGELRLLKDICYIYNFAEHSQTNLSVYVKKLSVF